MGPLLFVGGGRPGQLPQGALLHTPSHSPSLGSLAEQDTPSHSPACRDARSSRGSSRGSPMALPPSRVRGQAEPSRPDGRPVGGARGDSAPGVRTRLLQRTEEGGAFPKPAHPDRDRHFLYQPGFFFFYVAKGLPCGQCRGSHGLGLPAPVFTLGAGPDLCPLDLCPSAPVSRLTSPWLAVSVSLLPGKGAAAGPAQAPSGRGGPGSPPSCSPSGRSRGEPLVVTLSPPQTRGHQPALGPSPSRQRLPCSVSPSQSSGRTKAHVQDLSGGTST